MARIERRNDRWRARIFAHGRERSRTFDRKSDALRWASTQEADVARGQWIDPALGRMTFAEWADVWKVGLHDLRPTTEKLNLGVLRNHLLPRFGVMQLARVARADVRRMIAEDLDAGYSASATRRHVFVLRSVLDAAVEDGRIARNVAKGIKLPPERSRPMRFLEPAQVAALADVIRPRHYRPLVLTAAWVGLRQGELFGLAIDRVDLLRRTIVVDRQLLDISGRLQFGPPKTGAGVRTVTLPGALVDVLGEHFACQACQTSGLAFPTVTGRAMRKNNFNPLWRRAVDGDEERDEVGVFAGTDLAGLVFHELRHTAAALAIAHGAHHMTVKERLGHSSVTVTLDRYGHLFPAQDQVLAEALDATLRETLSASDRPEGDWIRRLRRSEG